ncbi:hypothetical protein ACIP88_33780 [Streptomyces uncialis]|uniref:hypothetical protein n=1 Tax=Streptomyces uncialis TaxID=1048205 RepID=UPI0038235F1C
MASSSVRDGSVPAMPPQTPPDGISSHAGPSPQASARAGAGFCVPHCAAAETNGGGEPSGQGRSGLLSIAA